MDTEQIAGHPTALRILGSGGAGSATQRPVLALHCSLAHGGAWSPLADRLEGVTLTAPDLPDHGASGDWDRTGSYHDLALRIAIALAERMGRGRPVDVFGHSFGGTVALRLALERPDLVRSLLLAEPVLFAAAKDAPVWPGFLVAQQKVAAALAAGDGAGAAAIFHADWGPGVPLDQLSERTRAYIVDRIGLVAALDSVLIEDRPRLLAAGRLEALDLPVLLVEGENSPPIMAAVQQELAHRIPGARRLRFAAAGHMLPITHAEALAPAVLEHLAAVPV